MADGEKSNATKSSNANSELNPQLQSIFTDIENNLPTINFDVSDVSVFFVCKSLKIFSSFHKWLLV